MRHSLARYNVILVHTIMSFPGVFSYVIPVLRHGNLRDYRVKPGNDMLSDMPGNGALQGQRQVSELVE